MVVHVILIVTMSYIEWHFILVMVVQEILACRGKIVLEVKRTNVKMRSLQCYKI